MLELTCYSKKEDNYSRNALSMALIAQLQMTGHQQMVLNSYSVLTCLQCYNVKMTISMMQNLRDCGTHVRKS